MFPRFRAAKLLHFIFSVINNNIINQLLSLATIPVLTAPSCTMTWLKKKPAAREWTFRNHGFTFDKIPVPPPPYVHAPRASSPHYHLSNSTIHVTISETNSVSALGSYGR